MSIGIIGKNFYNRVFLVYIFVLILVFVNSVVSISISMAVEAQRESNVIQSDCPPAKKKTNPPKSDQVKQSCCNEECSKLADRVREIEITQAKNTEIIHSHEKIALIVWCFFALITGTFGVHFLKEIRDSREKTKKSFVDCKSKFDEEIKEAKNKFQEEIEETKNKFQAGLESIRREQTSQFERDCEKITQSVRSKIKADGMSAKDLPDDVIARIDKATDSKSILELTDEELFVKGTAKFKKQEFAAAIYFLTILVEHKREDFVALCSLGAAYHGLHDFNKAIECYTAAIQKNDCYEVAYYNRGAAYHDMGIYDKAISDYTQATKCREDYFDAYYSRGVAYSGNKQYDLAIEDYRRALELKPDHFFSMFNLTELFVVCNNTAEASEFINKCSIHAIGDALEAMVLYLKAIFYKSVNSPDAKKAEDEYRNILKNEFDVSWYDFSEVESWIERIEDSELKKFVENMTKMMKEHPKPSR